jgi:hypothetical protein
MREPRDPLLKVVYDYYRHISPLITFDNIQVVYEYIVLEGEVLQS